MEINKSYHNPAFGAKFKLNEAIKEGIKYAEENKSLRTLESSLHYLSKANDGVITAIAGKTPDGQIFCNMTLPSTRKTVSISADDAKSVGEVVYNGMLEIGLLGRKFRTLFNVKEPTSKIDVTDIINYTV